MKKIITIILLALPFSIMAQTATDVQQMLRYRRYTTANKISEQLVKQDPSNAGNWYWLSQVLLQQKDSAGINELLQRIPAGLNDNPFIHVVKGNVALVNGQREEARHWFDKAVSETRSRDKDVLSAVARANIFNYTHGDQLYAIEQLKKAVKRDKRDPELYTLQGDAWFRLKNGSEAYKAFEKAVSLNGSYAPALYEMGKIFATQNNEESYLEYFNQTVAADPAFAPALYDLYYHYYKKDISKAYEMLTRYLAVADVKPGDESQLTDVLYLTKQYPAAIEKAHALLVKPETDNRLYKLLAYTHKEQGNDDSARLYMNTYFSRGADPEYLVKDYEFMADLFARLKQQDSVVVYYQQMLPLLQPQEQGEYYKKLADHYKEQKEYGSQAMWLGRLYNSGAKVTNVDLFNWGLALYQAEQYEGSDSVFAKYTEKYPDHVYGYYWRARSNAAIDSAMTEGIAVPHYRQMIALAETDTADATNRRYLVEAYGYIAAYIANEEKNYTGAIDYFEKLLELDPANNDAKRYIEILEKTTSVNSER